MTVWKWRNPHRSYFFAIFYGKGVKMMERCLLQGMPVTPEMPGACSRCNLYLDTCMPIVQYGFLAGAECDCDYCECCPLYEECGI